MSNSINRFPVISTHNKNEDKWFIFTIIAILLLAAFLLFWSVNDEGKEIKILPKEITPVINQLSSTADEISFLIAAELLPKKPNLLQLQQEAISPFDSRNFSSPLLGCFITDITSDVSTNITTNVATDTTTELTTAVAQYQVALWLDDDGHRLAWRTQQSGHAHHDDKHDEASAGNEAAHLCQQTGQGWQFITDNHGENISQEDTEISIKNNTKDNIEDDTKDNIENSVAAAHS
jgi:hypothetical protein